MPVDTLVSRFFSWVCRRSTPLLLASLLISCVFAYFVPRLEKDTSTDAFMPRDHPAIVYRDEVRETFGLADPLVVLIVNEGPNGVFNPDTLALVHWFTERIEALPKVNSDRVTSLATESDIIGTEDSLEVEPFFETPPETQEECDRIRSAVFDFELLLGNIVARDGSAALVAAELYDQQDAQSVYDQLLELKRHAPIHGEEIYFAGEGLAAGYLGAMIDRDTARLNPLAAIVIAAVLWLAYRRARGVVIPILVVLGAVAVAMGSMALAGVPIYAVTGALTVILIGIGVADGVHILGQYYEELVRTPEASPREVVLQAMAKMARPVWITSITTIAGFLAIAVSSFMPPMRAFGIFAAIGVLAALLFSTLVVPALLAKLPTKPSPAFAGHDPTYATDRFARLVERLGEVVVRHPGRTLVLSAWVTCAGLIAATGVQINGATIETFSHTASIYRADSAINQRMDGTNTLDVVVETAAEGGLYDPENLSRIDALQEHFESYDIVRGSTSMVEYVKQMNRALYEDRSSAYTIPDSSAAVAQYFLLYSMTGDPMDFEEIVDSRFQKANIRINMSSGLYRDFRPVIDGARQYIERNFNSDGIEAHIAGALSINYHWLNALRRVHPISVGLALLSIWVVTSLSFRSASIGLYSLVPVIAAGLLIYAVMGVFDLWLRAGTSMSTAIAIGLSVDFSIHTIERLRRSVREDGIPLDEAVRHLYPSTGRALLFNLLCIGLGFSVLLTSQFPDLREFGLLVIVCVAASFVASTTTLPALVMWLRPAFLDPVEGAAETGDARSSESYVWREGM